MREIVCILAFFPFITWIFRYKKHTDIVAPYNLYTFIYIFNIMIPTVLYANINSAETIRETFIREAVLNNYTYYTYIILQTLSYYLVIFGTKLKIGNKILVDNNKNGKVEFSSQEKYRYVGIIMWLVGVIAFFSIMNKVGGIYFFFTNLQYRTRLTRNLDFLSWILPFVNYGTLFIVYSYRGTYKPLSIKLIALIIISGIMSGLGGRKDLIILLIEALLLYHYCVKKLEMKKILNIKYIFGIIILYYFFIVMSKFRAEGAFEAFIQNPFDFIKESDNGILSIIKSESYVKYYIAMIEYFKEHSLWMGRTFVGLATAIIPSSLFSAKPPVDDGTYLYSIIRGRMDILPPMPFTNLDGSSYPLETFGSMYGNFGFIGLTLGMILLGFIYKYFYKKMLDSSYSLFSVVIYTKVIFTFQLSTLRIFQLFEAIVVFWFVTYICNLKFKFGGRNFELSEKSNIHKNI